MLLAFALTMTWTATSAQRLRAEPDKDKEIFVIVTAELFEVDADTYKKVARERWRSLAEWEKLEREFLNPPKDNKGRVETNHDLLENQKRIHIAKEVHIDPGQEKQLLAFEKAVKCLPTPDQVRAGHKKPQVIHEGISLKAEVHITADRRYLRIKFSEKSREIEGVEMVEAGADADGNQLAGETAFVREQTSSFVRYIPDGGTMLLPLQYQPRAGREKGRWLVVRIVPRIYIDAEERRIRER